MKKLLIILLLSLVGCSRQGVVEGVILGHSKDFRGLTCLEISLGSKHNAHVRQVCSHSLTTFKPSSIKIGRKARVYYNEGAVIFVSHISKIEYLE